MPVLRDYLDRLMKKEDLTAEEMKEVTLACFEPETTDTEFRRFLQRSK